MAKEVQMSIEMEGSLRDEFLQAAAIEGRPAAQIVRDFMREFISRRAPEHDAHEPNEETIAAMQEVERGEVFQTKDLEDFRRQLGIPCEK